MNLRTKLPRHAGFFLVAAVGVCIVAIFESRGSSAAAPAPHADAPAAERLRIAPGDRLCIGVAGLDPADVETLKTVRVAADGGVGLYFVGVLKIGGLTYEEAERTIAKAYTEGHLVQGPSVTVNWLAPPKAVRADDKLAAGDRISLKVFDLHPNAVAGRLLTINRAGTAGIPYLGQVTLAGLSDAEAESAIAKQYSERGLIHNPRISVFHLSPEEISEPTVDAPAVQPRP